jgi:hypothetical protein
MINQDTQDTNQIFISTAEAAMKENLENLATNAVYEIPSKQEKPREFVVSKKVSYTDDAYPHIEVISYNNTYTVLSGSGRFSFPLSIEGVDESAMLKAAIESRKIEYTQDRYNQFDIDAKVAEFASRLERIYNTYKQDRDDNKL